MCTRSGGYEHLSIVVGEMLRVWTVTRGETKVSGQGGQSEDLNKNKVRVRLTSRMRFRGSPGFWDTVKDSVCQSQG